MLGLGLGMGVGNKVPLLPVSAFPTVSAIPPGALVLDSDGTIWKKEADGSFSVISMTMAETVFVDENGNIFITENMNIFVED